VPQTLNPKP